MPQSGPVGPIRVAQPCSLRAASGTQTVGCFCALAASQDRQTNNSPQLDTAECISTDYHLTLDLSRVRLDKN
ncbi:hypothetical protein HG15A2_18290 [Adhaeretor mobilis]|uniref:Uncharacterized protein n=1 Tax=Adhaeretor mobilis TaxID=1930276 RepID=A0A517MUJ0_9BACT|nr:hypothetical protein HG15A2_18290 [Adhaeretor mobilis]